MYCGAGIGARIDPRDATVLQVFRFVSLELRNPELHFFCKRFE